MATTTGGFATLLAPGLRKVMFNAINAQPNQFLSVFNISDSTRAYEDDAKISGLGSMVSKAEGTNTTFDDPLTPLTRRYTHGSYGLGFRVTREMYDDDLYNIMKRMAAELGRAASYKVEIDAWSILNNAFSAATAAMQGFDGLQLVSTAHTRMDGGSTMANRPSTDVDFSYTAYQAALDHFNTLVDDRGRPIVMEPKLLIVSPSFEWAAREIFGSEYKPYTANNEINPLKSGSVEWMTSRYLTDDDSWFLLANKRQGEEGNGHDLNFTWRTRPETAEADDFMSGDALFKIFARYVPGFGEWRGVYGSSGG